MDQQPISTWVTALLAISGGILTVAAKDGIPAIIKLFKARATSASVAAKEAVGEWREICDRQQGEINESKRWQEQMRREMDALRERHHECEREQERSLAWQQRATDWILDAQAVFAAAVPKIHFRMWNPDPTPPAIRRPPSNPDLKT